MKSSAFLVVALALLPIAIHAAPALRAGAAVSDITPKQFPINMPGGFAANMAESAHDPLNARALVLDDGTTKIVMAVVDNLGGAQEPLEEAKEIAAQRTGIPKDHMLVSSTHSHSAAALSAHAGDGPAEVVAYHKVFVDGVADAIIRANAALQPAKLGAAADALPEEVFNRRWYLKPGKMPLNPFGKMDQVKMNPSNRPDVLDHPAGPTDPDITILSVRDAKNKALAVFANYSLHYVGAIPPKQISADYFGEFARLMPSRVHGDDNFVAIMSNGTSGDINNTPFGVVRAPREPFEQVRIVAGKAADTAWRAEQKIQPYHNDITLGMLQREITLRYRRPAPEEIANAKDILAIKDEEAIKKLPALAQAYAHSTLAAADRKEDTVTVKVQAIRIGDLAVCGSPFETFVETGLDLKKRSPFPHTMVIGLANGRIGYLPTPEQHQLGGYETWLGTNYVQEDTSVILTKNLLEMLADLWENK